MLYSNQHADYETMSFFPNLLGRYMPVLLLTIHTNPTTKFIVSTVEMTPFFSPILTDELVFYTNSTVKVEVETICVNNWGSCLMLFVFIRVKYFEAQKGTCGLSILT